MSEHEKVMAMLSEVNQKLEIVQTRLNDLNRESGDFKERNTLLTYDEVKDMLDVSYEWVRKSLAPKIGIVHLGRSKRLRLSDVNEYIRNNTNKLIY